MGSSFVHPLAFSYLSYSLCCVKGWNKHYILLISPHLYQDLVTTYKWILLFFRYFTFFLWSH